METKEQKIERKQEDIRALKDLKMDYERNIKDCEELIKKAEQQLKELEETEEIVKTKKYKRPDVLHCCSCPHCISFINYGDCENFYCLVDDKYKFNDYPEEKDCPFKEE